MPTGKPIAVVFVVMLSMECNLNWIYRLVIGDWVDVDTRGKSRICMVKFVKNRIAIVIWRIQRGTVVEIANSQERISLMVPLKWYDLQLNIYFAVE